jgi:hypothetical protein
MRRYISLEQFRKRFEVVHSDNLSAREPTSREPYKYYNPFIEREDSDLSLDV